jgi:glutathione peroxidase-family protein
LIVGFPANNFAAQEPGTNKEIIALKYSNLQWNIAKYDEKLLAL